MFFFYQHRYVHYRITPVIAYQETTAGNSSHHLKRMGEFLQCYVKRMKIILSPAKKINVDTDSLIPTGLPSFLEETTRILDWLKSKQRTELKELWKCNDKIADQNFERLEHMDLYNRLTPAILAYEGIAFQYITCGV